MTTRRARLANRPTPGQLHEYRVHLIDDRTGTTYGRTVTANSPSAASKRARIAIRHERGGTWTVKDVVKLR